MQGNVFCNAHGKAYPVDIEDRLFEFLKQGGGQMRFRLKLRTHRTAMAHEGNSGAKFPDRLKPAAVEIVDRDGRLTRG